MRKFIKESNKNSEKLPTIIPGIFGFKFWLQVDLEDVSNFSLGSIAFSSFLKLVNLFHLKMLHSSHMSKEAMFTFRCEFAQSAVVSQLVLREVWSVGSFSVLKVAEKQCRDLVLLSTHMNLKFVRAVAVEFTGVAPELNRVDAGQEPQLPFVAGSAFFDVVDVT